MSRGVVAPGPARDRWRSLTPVQRERALGSVVRVLGAALASSAAGVARELAAAGEVSPVVEEHVAWAARELTGPLYLVGDTGRVASRYLVEGGRARTAQKQTAQIAQEGMF